MKLQEVKKIKKKSSKAGKFTLKAVCQVIGCVPGGTAFQVPRFLSKLFTLQEIIIHGYRHLAKCPRPSTTVFEIHNLIYTVECGPHLLLP